jgi:predicted phage terminase large subunit-like protein
MIDRKLELQLKQEVFTASYYHFTCWCFNLLFPNERFEANFHIELLCNIYQDEIERIIRKEEKNKDIIVNIPPRASKSLITSVFLLPWMWLKDPTLPMISISFDEDLSLLNAQYSKDIITHPEFQELFTDRFQIRKDANSKGYFMNNHGGFRLSKTTGSNITGHKGVVIIVDDPQNPKTSESTVNRQATIDYYTRALYNRLTPINLGIRIIIMQRLHEDDLTGYLLKNNPEDYLHICLPATVGEMVNPPELIDKYQDGLLDPVRLSFKTLQGFRKTLGERGYSGQYDQSPAPLLGGIWKKHWFDIFNPLIMRRDVENEPINFYIDGAFTEKTENDPTGILATFKQDNYLYILDFTEVWLDFPSLIKFIIAYVQRFQYTHKSRIVIEPKANGLSIIQQLRAISGLNVIAGVAPKDDKITRANSVAPTIEARRVRLIDGTYVTDYLEKVSTFPNASHDESVDLTVMAIDDMLFNDGPDFFFVQQ